MGTVELPSERYGERPIADDAVGTALESVIVKRKAYWMATVIFRSQSDIDPQPDGRELIDVKWFTFADAKDAIRRTNHPGKATLLLKSLDACQRDLLGGPSPQERPTLLDGGG